MATVLVVDDAEVSRYLAGRLLERQEGMKAVYAENGREALAVIQREAPDLVLTDLRMPEMDGLTLVEAIRKAHPSLPVILMTAYGNEEVAIQALQKGAASYVPKQNLARDLSGTVQKILEVAQADRQHQRLMDCLTQTEARFVLESDPSLISPLVAHLQDNLRRMGLCDETELIRVAVALDEALLNAMHHGNLELNSGLREEDTDAYYALADARRQEAPYRDRRVHVTAQESRSEAVYVVRDGGPGFDPLIVPDPTDPANLTKVSGRGLLLIRTFMDEVRHNAEGNEITMIKRREG
ncbi:MAG: hypothetical protein A3F84_13830 [Candidatus Handelsmanbacteria bacterium RIFCSPLOWO2_12_FULL_64_10]|uniref:Response regulatory domain-containing protein n=1 Tax=Handelsmanbacteria sp. (strain RIFCSPLOWO2_12_FULL_64_10) TaxID=1817868 RepID=A0A1F6CZT9_HANXR|nr:MAG: hypothetical protein A3F84_13830 [Candidatus Handelsmanbacteria bacterium RIFCSPLOWO2_12_FULL_64_10]